MKTRKIVSLGLAALMSLSLAAPAFAAEGTNTKTDFTATYSEPDIDVVVPQTGAVALNPLGLDVEVDETSTIKGLQIVTTPTVIANHSKMKLDVNATVTTELKGSLKLTTSEQALVGNAEKEVAAKTDTSAFVIFQMKTSTIKGADDEDPEKINAEAATWAYDYTETIDAEGVVTPKDGCLILNGSKPATSSKALVTLAAGDPDAGESKDGGVAQMRITGKMVQSPKTAWASADGLTASVVFTFTPNTTP